jgi:hypothetical protein
VPTDVEEEEWLDHGEDIMEAYFGGPDPFFKSSEVDSFEHDDGISSELSHDFPYDPPDSPSVTGFPTPRQRASYLEGPPPLALHRPWARQSLSRSSSPQTSVSFLPSMAEDETLVVKAVLEDAIVMFRTVPEVSLAEVCQRVHEKFARTEVVPQRGAVALAYVPPAAGTGAKRVSTVSSTSTRSSDWARAMPLRSEGDWENAVAANCGPKITLRVSYRSPQ